MELVRVRASDTPAKASTIRDKRRLRMRFYAALLAGDTLAIIAGLLIANVLRFDTLFAATGLTLIAATLPLYWAFNASSFVPEVLEEWRDGLLRAFLSLLGAIAIVLFLAFFLKASAVLSRLVMLYGFFASCITITLVRAAIGRVASRVFSGGAISRIIICDDICPEVPVGVQVVPADSSWLTEGTPHPLALDRLARVFGGSDLVYIACPPERRAAWAAAMQGSAIHAEMLVPELKSVGIVGGRTFVGVPTVLVATGPFRLRDEIMKRALDLAMVVPALLFLAPLLLVVSIAIKLDSPGPVLFRQQRVGRGNRLFGVFKFRSMRIEASDSTGSRSAARDDDRITRIGRFIRSTSIDELPQLINILLGQMSFVGPRPHALGSLAGNQLFWEIDSRYHHRHSCKPGLTGLAQIRGFRGATHRREDLINRLHADLEYVNGWSVRRDLSIILATARVVVHKNAF